MFGSLAFGKPSASRRRRHFRGEVLVDRHVLAVDRHLNAGAGRAVVQLVGNGGRRQRTARRIARRA